MDLYILQNKTKDKSQRTALILMKRIRRKIENTSEDNLRLVDSNTMGTITKLSTATGGSL